MERGLESPSNYIQYEHLFTLINVAFTYLGLGECFQVRARSKIFCKLQTIIFIYQTIIAQYGTISGISISLYVILYKVSDKYFDAAQAIPCFILDGLIAYQNITIYNNKSLNKEIIKEIKDHYPKQDEDAAIVKILNSKMKPVKTLITFYSLITNMQPIAFCLLPMYMTFIMKKEPLLAFLMWYPYDYTASTAKYLFTMYTQFIAAGYTAFSLAAVDSALIIVMVNLSMHCELLAYRLRTLAPSDKKLSPDDHKTINTKLNIIVNDHVWVMSVVDKFQSLYSSIFFAKFLITSCLICQLLFSIMISPSRKVNFAMFLFSMLIQLFALCWYGQDLVDKSGALSQAAFDSGWPNFGKQSKFKIFNIQVRSQKVLEFNAMGFAKVSLQSFTSIINASWSFFTILRTMYEGSASERQ